MKLYVSAKRIINDIKFININTLLDLIKDIILYLR